MYLPYIPGPALPNHCWQLRLGLGLSLKASWLGCTWPHFWPPYVEENWLKECRARPHQVGAVVPAGPTLLRGYCVLKGLTGSVRHMEADSPALVAVDAAEKRVKQKLSTEGVVAAGG